MTKQEIAQWIRDWMKKHPEFKELNSMYDDFNNLHDSTVYDTSELTSLISGLHPLRYMTYIPSGMFYAGDITNVRIPNNITSIGWSAFEHCSSLTRFIIPKSVKKIGKKVFSGCINIPYLIYEGTMQEWKKIKTSKLKIKSGPTVVKCTDGELTLQ